QARRMRRCGDKHASARAESASRLVVFEDAGGTADDHLSGVCGDVFGEALMSEATVHSPFRVEGENAARSVKFCAVLLGGSRQLESQCCRTGSGDRLEVDPQSGDSGGLEDGGDEDVDLSSTGQPYCERLRIARPVMR